MTNKATFDPFQADEPAHVRRMREDHDRAERAAAKREPFVIPLPLAIDPLDDERVLVEVGGHTRWVTLRERDSIEATRTRRAAILTATTDEAREPFAGAHRVLVGPHVGRVVHLDAHDGWFAELFGLAELVE